MYPRRRYIELTFVLLISLSGILLGLSHNNNPLLWTAIVGAVVSFLLVDYLRIFHLTGWLANIASLLILLYAMKDFIGGDSAVKLISVAQLLVYLQCVLVFQKKTPRLYWQILVLSLLQVVVAAIFNLNFEGGVLFIAYFAVAMAAMMMQNDFSHWSDNRIQNAANIREHEAYVNRRRGGQQADAVATPCLVSPPRPNHLIGGMMRQVVPWLVAAFTFATILFYLVPRAEEAWIGPGMHRVVATGISKQVNLDERGVIRQNETLMFRVTFTDARTGESVQLADTPYFRGMPLPRLVIENDKTTWKAPYDSVFDFSYRPLGFLAKKGEYASQTRVMRQKIVLEGTADPLLYAYMPIYRPRSIDDRSEFCRDLSALTRPRKGDLTEMSSYKYEALSLVGRDYQTLKAWPYIANTDSRAFPTLDDAPGERAGLVYLDKARYPKIVQTANQIAQNTGSENTIELCNALLSHFTQTNLYTYTMDFRDVEMDRAVDPVEDFFANHRSGHCELYASALTMMLRSQDIPARVVLGFYGGEYNNLTNCYMVRSRRAHAWVEAYIPPKHCTVEMRQRGEAGRGGCWLTLDPTPPTDNAGGNEALDLARSFWQDYVLSMDENQQEQIIDVSTSGIFGFLQLGRLRPLANQTFVRIRNEPWLQGLLIVVIVVIALLATLINRRDSKTKASRNAVSTRSGRIRQLVGNALSLISPKLGALVLQDELQTIRNVPFYRRMTRSLGRIGLVREPHQTHREFAIFAIGQLSVPQEKIDTSNGSSAIAAAISEITERFYEVRFGNLALDNEGLRTIERTVEQLETELKKVKSVKTVNT